MRARLATIGIATAMLAMTLGLPRTPAADAATTISAAPFSCGPNTITYTVTAFDGRSGFGIRCVKYPAGAAQFAWYGEGQWGGATYRHVGQAHAQYSTSFQPLPLKGYAADIFGNGEDYQSAAPGTLEIEVVAGNWPSPAKIQVRGGWQEDWIRVESTAYEPLPAPTTCGPYFDEYHLSVPAGRPGSGLRCFLGLSNRSTWFGNGEWAGARYTHLGTLDVTSMPVTGDAADLCGPAFGDYCGKTPPDALTFTPAPTRGFDVTGAWNESWR